MDATASAPHVDEVTLLRVDEFARRAGTTVRHIRTLTGRGLLAGPILQGRTGYYGPEHLAQLTRIVELQERGWSMVAIEDLLGPAEPDPALAQLLPGLGLAGPQVPEPTTDEQLAERLGPTGRPDLVQRLRAAGVITGDATTPVVQVPAVIDGLRAMTDRGIPAEQVVELTERLAPMVDEVADTVVTFVAEELFQRLVDVEGAAPDAVQQAVTATLELHPYGLAAAVGLLSDRLVARAAERVAHRVATGEPLPR